MDWGPGKLLTSQERQTLWTYVTQFTADDINSMVGNIYFDTLSVSKALKQNVKLT